jgi:hypothetical protein
MLNEVVLVCAVGPPVDVHTRPSCLDMATLTSHHVGCRDVVV